MNFRRFEHVNQVCQNLEATQQFYQTLFPEWKVRAEGGTGGSHRWIHFGNEQFYLSLSQRSNPEIQLSGSAVPSELRSAPIDHLGFVIENGEAMKALLDSNGIEYFTDDSPETKWRIYVSDPDGTAIELVEYDESYALK